MPNKKPARKKGPASFIFFTSLYYNDGGYFLKAGSETMKKSFFWFVILGGGLLLTIVGLAIVYGSTTHSDLKGNIQQKLQTFMDKKAAEMQFSGTVLVAGNGKILFQKGYGFADFDSKTPNQLDTEYRIASLTKSFTALSILQLEAAGKLKTSDPISKYFPAFQNGEEITIHNLLTHSSGVESHYRLTDYSKPITMADFIELMSKQKLTFTPGSKYMYSDTGYMILAGVIEKVSGESYGNYLRDHIFRIAEMNHTYLSEADVSKMATGYQNLVQIEMKEDESQLKGSGDIISTAGDLLKYIDAIHYGRLLPPEEVKNMETGYINSAPWGVFKYGYGWQVADNFISFGKPMIEHNGSLPGFKSEIVDFVHDRVSVIVLSNNNGTWNSGALSRELASICLDKRFWFYQKYF
jgi:CubicO group peptidase (beta-lactamase class C family)